MSKNKKKNTQPKPNFQKGSNGAESNPIPVKKLGLAESAHTLPEMTEDELRALLNECAENAAQKAVRDVVANMEPVLPVDLGKGEKVISAADGENSKDKRESSLGNKKVPDANVASVSEASRTDDLNEIGKELAYGWKDAASWFWSLLYKQWNDWLRSLIFWTATAFAITLGIIALRNHNESVRLAAENRRIELVEEKYRTLRHWAEHDKIWRVRFLQIDRMYSDTLYYRDDIEDLQRFLNRQDSVAAKRR